MQAQAETQKEDDKSIADNKSIQSNCPLRVGWNGLLIGLNKRKQHSLYNTHDLEVRLKKCITLNNGSTLSLFSNPDLLQDIQTTRTTLALATNAGVKESNQEALVPGSFNKDAIANIIAFSDLKTKHRITYDSNKKDAFLVHMDNKILKFECTPEGLYQYKVSKDYRSDLREEVTTSGTSNFNGAVANGTSNLISTVAKNQKGYTLH